MDSLCWRNFCGGRSAFAPSQKARSFWSLLGWITTGMLSSWQIVWNWVSAPMASPWWASRASVPCSSSKSRSSYQSADSRSSVIPFRLPVNPSRKCCLGWSIRCFLVLNRRPDLRPESTTKKGSEAEERFARRHLTLFSSASVKFKRLRSRVCWTHGRKNDEVMGVEDLLQFLRLC